MRLINKTRFSISIAVALLIIAGTILIINKINIKVQENKTQQENIVIQTEGTITLEQEIIPTTITDKKEETKVYYDIPLSEELQDFIREKCNQYDIDMEVILSIMHVESKFNHNVSSKNQIGGGLSLGIMQLNQNYINWYKELTGIQNFNINNQYDNIEAGIAVFKFYKSYWENKGYIGEELLIRSYNCYNMGIKGFKKYVKNTGQISRGYDKRIREYKDKLSKIK